jgi:hypothetical protein
MEPWQAALVREYLNETGANLLQYSMFDLMQGLVEWLMEKELLQAPPSTPTATPSP